MMNIQLYIWITSVSNFDDVWQNFETNLSTRGPCENSSSPKYLAIKESMRINDRLEKKERTPSQMNIRCYNIFLYFFIHLFWSIDGLADSIGGFISPNDFADHLRIQLSNTRTKNLIRNSLKKQTRRTWICRIENSKWKKESHYMEGLNGSVCTADFIEPISS